MTRLKVGTGTNAPKLSICIPTFNRSGLLKRQLKSLELALLRIPSDLYEVIISDNASHDDTQQVIADFGTRVSVKSVKNSKNIGANSNFLLLPSNASGKLVWLLGDDDLVLPDAVENILTTIEEFPSVKGYVASHAIEGEEKRDRIENDILNDKPISCSTCLIRPGEEKKVLDRYEEVFHLTDIAAAFNFLSNVIFYRIDWLNEVNCYLTHCKSNDDLTDTITAGVHTHIWAKILIGKPVAVLHKPLVVGFVGQQECLSRWDVICWVFFLDISQWYMELGASPECVSAYKKNIYRNSSALGRIATANDPYSKKYFSMRTLLTTYGNDAELWNTLTSAFYSLERRKTKFVFVQKFCSALLLTPEQWIHFSKILFSRIVSMSVIYFLKIKNQYYTR